ncbi:MAG: COX15/CtaA family protein, partial [Longimicrobiales bacterium]
MAPRLLQATLVWTLALLLLGSVVHATESSLACPDWPTCFGTMTPEMTGGVFWEHLHRLWAGGLVLLFAAAVVLIHRGGSFPPALFKAGLFGLALLIVQSILGGITVIYRLPDAVSTSHLSLAFL